MIDDACAVPLPVRIRLAGRSRNRPRVRARLGHKALFTPLRSTARGKRKENSTFEIGEHARTSPRLRNSSIIRRIEGPAGAAGGRSRDGWGDHPYYEELVGWTGLSDRATSTPSLHQSPDLLGGPSDPPAKPTDAHIFRARPLSHPCHRFVFCDAVGSIRRNKRRPGKVCGRRWCRSGRPLLRFRER